MEVSAILKKTGIKPDEPVVSITTGEALEYLLETIDEYCSTLCIEKMGREDLRTLLSSYGSAIIMYHPEKNHRERAALLENFDMLKKYGLTEDDYDSINFC